MADAAPGYITDIPYTAQFHLEHAPVWFTATLAALGRPQPGIDGAHWCEVGCGPGFGLVLLAATNPAVTFHGIDINPRHIALAREMAAAAGIANVAFECADLRQAEGGSDFDYIVVRGLYSWVSPEVRLAIRRFLGQRLKPGGAALLHHLSLPGATDLMGVHGLFRALYVGSGLSPREAIRTGQDILTTLKDSKAGFFKINSLVEFKATRIASDEVDYNVHDYLNEHYTPLGIADVIHQMAEEGLHFSGSAWPLDNLDDFTVPGNLRGLFHAQKSLAMRETIRDLACNKSFRTDLYMRNPGPLAREDYIAALRALRFMALPGLPKAGSVSFDTQIGKVEGPAEVFAPVLERFAGGDAVAYPEIEALPAFAANPGLVNQVLHALMGSGGIHPVPRTAPDPGPSRRLNAVLLERYRAGERVPALAVPVLASGLAVEPAELDALGRGAMPARLAALLAGAI